MPDSTSLLGRTRPREDDLVGVDGAERLWATLPSDNPLELQRLLCDAIAKGANWTTPDIARFRALRALDARVSRLLTGTLWECASLSGQSPALERKLWHTALEVSRSFAGEFERYLRALRAGGAGGGWAERAPEILVRLFFHREIELTLTMFQYERWPRGRLRSLYEAYRYALDARCEQRAVPIGPRGDGPVTEVTPEQALARVLLLGLLDGGQFRPDEIVRARRAIAGWVKTVSFVPLAAFVVADSGQSGFVVDLAGAEGLVRSGPSDAGDLHWLDTVPLARAIEAAQRAGADKPGAERATLERLYARLALIFAPERQIVARRGERTPMALTSVEAGVGRLQTIFRMLRRDARRVAATSAGAAPYAEEITITDLSQTRAGARPAQATQNGDESVEATSWHVRDRSASGIRLRGRKPDVRRLLPGMLIALRDDAVMPWTVGVVRRVARLMGNNVEIGVEQIARNPQRVVLIAPPPALQRSGEAATSGERFIALYLPELVAAREARRTLLMPACEYEPGRLLTMLSTTRETAIRCGEALERQPDFVWASFEVVAAAPLSRG